MLADTLQILESPASEQQAYLERLGTWPSLDELGLELDDIVGAYLGETGIDEPSAAPVRALDALLRDTSDASPDLWEGPALSTDKRWAEVRRLAAAAPAAFPRAAVS